MATLSNLNVGIGTELGGLRTGLSKASKMMTSFSEGVESQLGSISTQRLEQGLSNIGTKAVPSANKLSQSLKKVQRPAQNTTMAVTNLNRVVQDAPFGIMGVANNIEPLIQSFNGLKASTGSTTGALKTLITSAFTGPGALITAVSVASSALIAFQMGMFDLGEEAKDTEEDLGGIIDRLDRIVELRAKFGEFDDDPFGLTESIATREEIDQLLAQQESKLEKINRLNEEARKIEAQRVGPQGGQRILTQQQEDRLEVINSEIQRLGTIEGIEEKIADLEQRRAEVGKDIDDTLHSMTDEDVVQAEKAQEKANAAERQLEAQRELSTLQMGGFVEVPAAETERMADALIKMPKSPFSEMNNDLIGVRGSIADLEMRLQAFTNMRAVVDPASQAFDELTQSISLTEEQLAQLRGETEKASKQGVQNIDMLAMGFGRLTGQIIKGKKEALSFSNIMSAVLPGLLNVLFPGGGSGFKFLSGVVGGIFHDGGVVPGPMGQEQLALVQGGETIRTPAQERSLGSGQVQVHVTGEFRQRGSDLVATINKTTTGTLR